MSRILEERRCNLVLKIRAKTDKSFNQRNERWYETISFVERVSNGLCFCLHWLYLLPSHLNSSLFLFIFAFLEMLEKKVIAKTFKVSRHEAAFWNKVKTHGVKWSAPLLDFFSFSECTDTEQILNWQVLWARWVWFFTSSQMQESNPGRLDEKRERYLCAMPSPHHC